MNECQVIQLFNRTKQLVTADAVEKPVQRMLTINAVAWERHLNEHAFYLESAAQALRKRANSRRNHVVIDEIERIAKELRETFNYSDQDTG